LEGTLLRVTPGSLNTTLHETALGELNQPVAAEVLNCDTGRGIFERDRRYRRFQSPPLREYEADAEELTTEWVTGAGSSVARTGSTDAWTGLTNAQGSDDQYATSSPLVPGDKTEYLRFASFQPPVVIPAAAVLGTMSVEVEASVDPDTGLACDVEDDAAYFLKSSVIEGANQGTGVALPVADAVRTYELDLAATGITYDDLNNGLVGFQIGYAVDPAVAYDPADWDIDVSPVSPVYTDGALNLDVTTNFVVTLTYTGGGSAPPYVIVELTGYARASGAGVGAFSANYGGSVTVDNGLGGFDSGAVMGPALDPPPTLREVTTTVSRRVDLVAGVGTTEVSMHSTTAITGANQQGTILHQLDAEVTSPSNTTVKVDRVRWRMTYTAEGETVELQGAQGVGYGEYAGADEFTAVWGQGAFRVDASTVEEALDDDWSAELSGVLLDIEQWMIWQYKNFLFYTNPYEAVYFREIGTDVWETLYRDTQSPGSTGDAEFSDASPPYEEIHELIAGDAVAATVEGGGPSVAATIEGGLATIETGDRGGGYGKFWIELEITYATAKVLTGNVFGLRIQQVNAVDSETTGNDGFSDLPAANCEVEFETAAAAVTTLPLTVRGKLDQPFGEMCGFVDLTTMTDAAKASVKKLRIKFECYQTGKSFYRLMSAITRCILYKDAVTPLADQVTSNVSDMEYAYNFTEGATTSQARTLIVPKATHLGDQEYSGVSAIGTDKCPFYGSVISVRVPRADAPFTAAATGQLYRKVDDVWYKIHTWTNTEDLIYEDLEPDSVADGSTQETPSFEDVAPSGSASGVICGCAWKGSNIFSHTDGKIYMSRTNTADEVLWDDVVLTNDPGSDDLGPARTTPLADDNVSPAILLLPAENLYAATAKEVYVFIAGDTAYNSSYPRKIDGVRGALGIRSGCVYGDRALIGCQDGLWAVKKSSDFGLQPDELIELTKDVRGSWTTLLGSSPSTVVIRQILGEVWCFNEDRVLHLTKTGQWIPGRWGDGREVNDATSDPNRGLVLQMTDGSLGVIGDFPTDGGSDVLGSDGTTFTWLYRPGKRLESGKPLRLQLIWESDADAALVVAELETELCPAERMSYTDSSGSTNVAVSRKHGGDWRDLTLEGSGRDRILQASIEFKEEVMKR
jgi:hypothetical protein